MGTTPFIAPDGSTGEIPNARVQEAVKAGGKIGSWVLAPDGTRGIVPQERLNDALRAGGRPVAPTNTDIMHQDPLLPAGGSFNPFSSQKPEPGTLGARISNVVNSSPAQAAMNVLPLGGVRGPIEAAAGKLAPDVAESALRITDRNRAFAKDIGEKVLENTHGIKISTLAPSIREAVANITADMRGNIDAVTKSGSMGSTATATQGLDAAIAKVPRNAQGVSSKLESLKDLLHLGDASKTDYTPSELYEMKQGIGKEIKSWAPEWQKSDDVQRAKQAIYNGIDQELDRLVPGNKEKNDLIGALVEAKRNANRISGGASIAQRVANRFRVPTGALISGAVGEEVGRRRAGVPGAIAGAIAGATAPEMVASTPAQMGVARLLNGMSNMPLTPAMIRILATLAGTHQDTEQK